MWAMCMGRSRGKGEITSQVIVDYLAAFFAPCG